MKKIFTLISILSVSASYLWAQATPNAGFENWTNSGYDVATGWNSPNSQTSTSGTYVCVKATNVGDIHSGAAALKLTSKNITILFITTKVPGSASTGVFPTSPSGSITGGIAYTLRPDSIVGWYKYTSVSADNGNAEFILFGAASGNTDTVGIANFNSPTTTVGSYTRFSAPIIYRNNDAVANSMWILSSSRSGSNPNIGSTLFIDDLAQVFVSHNSIVQTTGTNPMCSGQSATFTATATHYESATPFYQWKVNGSNVGTNSPTYTTTTLTTGQVVTCVLTATSTDASLIVSPFTSNAITMTINAAPATPTINQSGLVLTSSATIGNQWYKDGVLIAGATGQNYTVTQIGNYTVIVTTSGCPSLASAGVNITTTGIKQSSNDSFFTVYPNPSDGNFNVSFNIVLRATYKLELKNAIGQFVYGETLNDFSGTYFKQMKVSQFGKGIYVISLTNENNETFKKVLVY